MTSNKQDSEENLAEIKDLGTHEMGAVNLHKTIVTDQPVTIESADAPGVVTTGRNKK